MLVIPAIDLKDGKCVRLFQGDMDQSTIYGTDPLLVARRWVAEGARLLHIVDLNGAVAGAPAHGPLIESINREMGIPVQVGGGIRTMEAIERYLTVGVARVVLGTVALEDPELLERACRSFPGRVGAGIDSRNGWVSIRGWKETSPVSASDLARRSETSGASFLVCTDILRDGTQQGINMEVLSAITDRVAIPVIASGGVGSLKDIAGLKTLGKVEAVIVGKALYSGAIQLREAILAGEGSPSSDAG